MKHIEILASLLDDCWEPASALDLLREQVDDQDPRAGGARRWCLVIPNGEATCARIVAEGETFDDSVPPGRTRWLWVLAAGTPSREDLLRLYDEHGEGDEPGQGVETPTCEMIREEFIGLIDLLGSEEGQRDYQRTVEWVHTPTEMMCMFFDDLYHPDSAHWASCFSSEELNELRSLHAAVEAAAEDVSHDIELDQLLKVKSWQSMMEAARHALSVLSAHDSPMD